MDQSLTPGIKQAGDVECISIKLFDPKNNYESINLLGAFNGLTFYEDIFSPVVTGQLILTETQNLLSSMPIVNGERLDIEFKTPTHDTPLKFSFIVSKVGARVEKDKGNAYTLELISYECYLDLDLRISKAYVGNAGDIARKVYKDFFNGQMTDSDICDNNIKFVSPYWGPLKIINYATSRAILPNSKLTTPNFLFYQTHYGHKFNSITTMMNKTPITEYVYDNNPARVSDNEGNTVRDIDREYRSILGIEFISAQDHMKNMMNGAYNHRVFGVNLLTKKFDVKTYNYTTDFDKTTHTDNNQLNVLIASTSSGLVSIRHTTPLMFDGVNDMSDEIIAKRISLLAQLETWKINIRAHGRNDIEAGATVSLKLNQFKSVDMSDVGKDLSDPLYSGKYLITAVAHKFTQAKYECNMELIKDASFSEIKIK
jgi:hypothetical protein